MAGAFAVGLAAGLLAAGFFAAGLRAGLAAAVVMLVSAGPIADQKAPISGLDGIGMPFAAPFTACEVVHVHDFALGRGRVIPVFVVTFFPAMMGYDDHRNVQVAHRAIEFAQVVEQAVLFGDGVLKVVESGLMAFEKHRGSTWK